MAIPSTEPSRIVVGDRAQWRKELSDYPAPAWVLKYHLRSSISTFEIVADPDGAAHLVDVLPSVTAEWVPGDYLWFAVAHGSARHTVGNGRLIVQPDPTATAVFDIRDHPERIRDVIEAALEGRLPLDETAPVINGKALTDHAPEALMELLKDARRRIALREEKRRMKSPAGRSIAPRFA